MISYLLKWGVASLLMPLLVILFGRGLNNVLVIVFWPGSIALMSLGAEKRPSGEVIYKWMFAVSLNVLLYLFIGVIIYYIMKMIKA